MAWHRHALKWGGMGGMFMVLLLLLLVAGFLWVAGEYTRSHPLDLTARIPQVEKYLLPEGMRLEAERAELFFDNGPVVRVGGLALRGPDGTLGVFVEQAAIQLSSWQLLLLSPAPKVIEASGVTLRVVRNEDGIGVAGLNLPKSKNKNAGVVEWLNAMAWDRVWARLNTVKVANLNLLVRDDVQKAEWVLERGNLAASRYPDEGEQGTLTAVVRRLYGDVKQVGELDNVPVLVSFAHKPKADGLEIRGRLDRANAQMVTDYFPPQFKDLLQAEGQVEVGTRVMKKNRMAQPWVTLRMTNVKVQPPQGYSKALKFPKLTLTVSYVPLMVSVAGGVTSTLPGSDVLSIWNLEAVTTRGNALQASGTITGLQGDPMVDMKLVSKEGEGQGIFDLFPDEMHGFSKALAWLRPNFPAGTYKNLVAHYAGRPKAFPGCGETCGTLDIDAQIEKGEVRFLKELSPLKAPLATFKWRGQTVEIDVPAGKIAAQAVSDMHLRMSQIFSVSPTELRVSGNIKGDVHEVMAELAKMPETRSKVPQGITGMHASSMAVLIPMPRGQEATFEASTILVTSTLVNVAVSGLPELKGLTFAAPQATASMTADKTLLVSGDGTLGIYPMKVDWSMNIAPKMPPMMRLVAEGTVGGEWLTAQAATDLVSLTGPLGVAVNALEDKLGKWQFGVKADGSRVALKIEDANYSKAKGERLAVDVAGSYVPSGSIVLNKLAVLGNKLAVQGTVNWNPDNVAANVVKLPNLQVGDTDVSVDFAGGKANVTGRRIDLRGYDLFGNGGTKDPSNTQPDNLLVNVNVDEVLTEKGKLDNLVAAVKATKGRWDLQKLTALVNGKSRVNVQMVALKNQPGRKKLTIDVQDLGSTLAAMGIYDQMSHGKMTGEITYDTPDVGGGIIRIDDFELKNPPVLVQLLSLLSLEQLLAGTNATRFKTASIPLRMDGGVWYIDNASFEGPSMDLRLNGSYTRATKQLDMDGKMVPGIPLNRLVSKIPLLGALLTGSQDGLVVADFKLKGSAEDPQINVRPLSVITPGLLKDFWRGLTGDTAVKAKPVVIDGSKK